MRAICISCGVDKKAPYSLCKVCGLQPQGEDLVKSVYRSAGRFHSVEEQEQYLPELTASTI